MQIVNPSLISGKRVLLRLDIDVPIKDGKVMEDFRLKAGMPTLNLCLQNVLSVTILGHIGRPEGKEVEEFKVEPVREWLIAQGYEEDLVNQKLIILENLRFDPGEEECNAEYAQKLADKGDIFINEAFASYHPAASTTILPAFLLHAAGLRFAEEIRVLKEVRDNPKKPFVAILGGAKVEDKLSVVEALAKKADAVLVGGKLVQEIREQNITLPKNVMVGMLTGDGFDIVPQTTEAWSSLIKQSRMIVWNGPLGKFEDKQNDQSVKLAKIVLASGAEIVVGGGDTISLLRNAGLLGEYEQKGFVSVGGGAMLKFLSEGTLPTIEALK